MLQVFSTECFKNRSGGADVAIALVVGRRHGSPCGRLRPADASTTRIHRQGEAGMAGTLLSVMAQRGNGPPVMWAWQLRFCYTGTGRCGVDAFEWEPHLEKPPVPGRPGASHSTVGRIQSRLGTGF